MKRQVVLAGPAAQEGRDHLLRHYDDGRKQEELCFALWRQSTGTTRKTAIIYQLIKPQRTERSLHGNASFEPHYLGRVIREARQQAAGVAFLHSHPTPGWQDMSLDDIIAEKDVISYPARVTKHPLVGLTIGRDGYWSARWWEQSGKEVKRFCVTKFEWSDERRTRSMVDRMFTAEMHGLLVFDEPRTAWGPSFQRNIEALNVGVVGIGSVGSIAAEAFARIGVGSLTLIDGDRVEEHNLDRLLHATQTRLERER